jgi:anti-sigma B factor antagonist
VNAVRSSPRPPFSVSVDAGPHEVIAAPRGDLDLAVADAFERKVRELGRDGRIVVIDLRGVDFLDSSGLRSLLSLRNDAKRNHHQLVLVPGPPGVRRVFHLTGTRGLFDWRGA